MSIRTKIGIILLCAVIGFGIAEYGIQRYVILPEFLSLEQENAVKDVRRVVYEIQNEIEHLNSFCWDWAAWDDTYDFVKTRSSEYISSNLVLTTFTDNNLNLIHILDRRGRMVWGMAYDLNTSPPAPVKLLPETGIAPGSPLFPPINDKDPLSSAVKGILMSRKGPMMVAACPILKSSDKGPARGVLIMGRLIDEAMAGTLAAHTQVDFSLLPLTGKRLPDRIRRITKRITKEAPFLIEPVDEARLNAYTILPDLNRKPALLLSTTFPRDISAKGYKAVKHEVYSILLAGLFILLMALLILKLSVLNPVDRLTGHAIELHQTADFTKRLNMSRKDEIGTLATAFDRLVELVEHATQRLVKANRSLQKDMDLRLRAEAELRENMETFRSLVEQAGDAVFVNDLDGRLRFVNQVACDRLGYDEKELLQMMVQDIDPDYVQCEDRRQFWERAYQSRPIIFESRHKRKDGGFFPVEVSLTPIRYKGERLVLSIVRDITRRKAEEDRSRYTHKMEAVSTLTAGIAHNFNNILSVIIGSADLAELKASSDRPDRELIRKIRAAGMRAKEIVEQLICFSRTSIDDFRAVAIDEIIQDASAALAAATPGNIRIETDVQTGCRPILANEEQIRLLLTQLWENAVEAMAEGGGTLSVRLENADPDATGPDADTFIKPDGYVRLSVEDTGRGIDPAVINRVFEPYFSSKDFSKGAGMGLAIVYGIVQSMGARITVDSTPGEGARIDILFQAVKNTA